MLGLGGLKHDLALLLEASPHGLRRTTSLRFEFAAADHPLGIAVDQPADATLQAAIRCPPATSSGVVRSSRVFRRRRYSSATQCGCLSTGEPGPRPAPRAAQHGMDGSHRSPRRQSDSHQLPCSDNTAVAPSSDHGTAPQGLAIIGVPAAPADGQPLQQPARTTASVPLAPSILGQLGLSGLEERRRQGPAQVPRSSPRVAPPPGGRAGRRLGMPPERPQPWPGRQVARMAVDGAPEIGRVGQHAADRRGIPARGAMARGQPVRSRRRPTSRRLSRSRRPRRRSAGPRRPLRDDLKAGTAATLMRGI